MTINHLVIGGGGPNGFMFFGAMKYLKEKLFWNNDNINPSGLPPLLEKVMKIAEK